MDAQELSNNLFGRLGGADPRGVATEARITDPRAIAEPSANLLKQAEVHGQKRLLLPDGPIFWAIIMIAVFLWLNARENK